MKKKDKNKQTIHKINKIFDKSIKSALKYTLGSGPIVTDKAAKNTVTRIKTAAEWIRINLDDVTKIKLASAIIEESPLRIVERKKLNQILNDTLGVSPYSLIIASKRKRTSFRYSQRLCSLWICAGTFSGQVVVAPNILATANKYDINQDDYARYCLLNSTLWGGIFTTCPWLKDFLEQRLLHNENSDYIIALLQVVVDYYLGLFAQELLPAITWIKAEIPQEESLSFYQLLYDQSPWWKDSTTNFFNKVSKDLGSEQKVVRLMLRKPQNLPTILEITDPREWVDRMQQ